MAGPLKLSIVRTFYQIICFSMYQRLTQIQSFSSTFPRVLRKEVIEQYHENDGHMGIDKPIMQSKQNTTGEMYKNIYQNVTSCVTCQTRNLRKVKPLQQETDNPPYPFMKFGPDVSGPRLSGNKYIIGFVDWYSG